MGVPPPTSNPLFVLFVTRVDNVGEVPKTGAKNVGTESIAATAEGLLSCQPLNTNLPTKR